MIKEINNKQWVTKKGNSYICPVAIRVCDGCGEVEECRYATLLGNRRKRKSSLDYCYSCAQKKRVMPTGKNYALWKHGITYNGYSRITVNRKRILEHVYVMEKFLNRSMESEEVIHHIDMNKLNNNINNLYLFPSQKDHQACHISMEVVGLDLLNKHIWFDWTLKQYVCYPTEKISRESPCVVKPTNAHVGISYGRSYIFYNEKNDQNKWRHKRYHVLLMETFLGRKMFKDECVHHVDGNTLNNNFENLCLVTKSEHGAAHCSLQKAVAEMYNRGIVTFENGVYFL